MVHKMFSRVVALAALLVAGIAVTLLAQPATAHAHAAASKCYVAHVDIAKRNGPSEANVIARYSMNKAFCTDGTKLLKSDPADVKGYVKDDPFIKATLKFAGNISKQDGTVLNGTGGESTAQGNFTSEIKIDAGVKLPIIGGIQLKTNDLNSWQPAITIRPSADGGFNYVTAGKVSDYDLVTHWSQPLGTGGN